MSWFTRIGAEYRWYLGEYRLVFGLMTEPVPPVPLGTDPDRLLSYAQVAEHTGVPERSVRKWPHQGLRVIHLGRHVRVRAGDLLVWIDDQYRDAA